MLLRQRIILFIAFFTLFYLEAVNITYAQRCRTYEHFISQYNNDTVFSRKYDNLQKLISKQTKNYLELTRGLDTIPIVVHILYNTPSQNINLTQVQSQIDVLNTDYARLNADTVNTPSIFKSVATGTNFRFALARRDPTGNPTTGIVRVYTNRTSFADDNTMKFSIYGGDDVWDRDKYLNIWVCNLTGGILGYTEYSGGNKDIDGVVVNYQCFGTTGNVRVPYNLGRTTTHEIGHWFNLIHIWGDDGGSCSGSDSIGDTPNQADSHYDCPGFPYSSCSNTSDMFMNYMDYTPDSCMNIFTKGQLARMRAAYKLARFSVDTSYAFRPVYTRDLGITEITQPRGIFCDSIFNPEVTFFNYGHDSFQRVFIQYTYDSNMLSQYVWHGTLLPGGYINLVLPSMKITKGIHTFKCFTVGSLNNDNYTANDTLRTNFTVNRTTLTKTLPLIDDFETYNFPENGWNINNPDNDVTWTRDSGLSAYGIGAFSIFMDNNYIYTDITGTVDAFTTPEYNFSSATNPSLKFDLAYAGYYDNIKSINKYDRLKVYYSTDCGQSWTDFYDKSGIALETAPAQTAQFVPSSTQWRSEYLILPELASQNAVQFKFENISGWGNELYIDNIKVYADASHEVNIKPQTKHFAIYPNPVSKIVHIENPNDEYTAFEAYDMKGNRVLSGNLAKGDNDVVLSFLSNGIYLFHIYNGNSLYTQKIYVNK